MEDELAALIRKSDAGDMKTIEDLVRHNEGKKKEEQIGFIVVEQSPIDAILRSHKDPTGRKIFDLIEANKETSRVKTYEDGKKEVKNNGKVCARKKSYFDITGSFWVEIVIFVLFAILTQMIQSNRNGHSDQLELILIIILF